jgi:hypothetical protein
MTPTQAAQRLSISQMHVPRLRATPSGTSAPSSSDPNPARSQTRTGGSTQPATRP